MVTWRFIAESIAGPFLRDRRGNVAMMWGLMGAVLVGLIGLTVDFARAQAIRAQMQNAVDGAALVAERSSNLSMEARTAAARAFFDAEMGHLAADADFSVEELDDGGHRATASLPMPLSLARIIRNEDWVLAASADAQANASPPIEVVLALDNTGSMVNDMDTLRDGAEDLVEYLMRIDGDTISVGVVPFVAQVNIGNQAAHLAWMDTAGNNPQHGEMLEDRYLGARNAFNGACADASRFPATFGGFAVHWIQGPVTGVSGSDNTKCYAFSPSQVNMFDLYTYMPASAGWGGCVEARPPPYDINDAVPTTGAPATMFTPFFALDEGANEDHNTNNWVTSTTYDPASDILQLSSGSWTVASRATTLSVYKYRSGVTVSLNTGNGTSARGPNRGCPTPILPLTTSRDAAVDSVRDMVHWYGGGTNQIEGLAWAWRVISPGAPFTEGRPYNDPNDPVRKVIVLFTDGDNTSLDTNNTAFESEYSALSYRRLWRVYQSIAYPSAGSPGIDNTYQRSIANLNGTNDDNDMVTYMNARQRTLCDAIKAAGIEIYTIGFRITDGGTAEQLLEYCATDGEHYFDADNQEDLLEAFSAIGTGIGKLRLTR